jgi:hypothetical protein
LGNKGKTSARAKEAGNLTGCGCNRAVEAVHRAICFVVSHVCRRAH